MSDIDHDDIRRLDGGLLLVFRELTRRGRTTAVAAHLGLSQSAVSHALARLRDIFGDPLFLRRPHGLAPTRRAQELAPRIDALIDMMGAAIGGGAGFDAARSERLFQLAATEYAVGVIDGPFVAAVHAEAPRSAFIVQHLRGHQALSALRRGQIDLAIGRFDAPPDGIVAEPLLEDRYCVVARRGHPTIDGAIDVVTWASTGHVFCANYTAFDDIVGPTAHEDAIPSAREVATAAVVPRWETALSLVAGSDAIATCPRRLAEQQAGALRLQVLTPPLPSQSWTLSLARRDETDEGLDWFSARLREAAARG